MKDVVGSGVLIGIGIFYLVCAWELESGTFENPGPGLFPIIIGLILVGTNVLHLFFSLGRQRESRLRVIWEELKPRNILCAAMVVGAVAVYLVVLQRIGFLLVSPLLVFFLAWVMGGKHWVINLILGMVSSVLIYWIFWVVMRVPIPTGLL